MRWAGVLFCLSSAAAFGAMAVFGKLAYEDGATVGTLLAVRFGLAAAISWLILIGTGGVGELRRLAVADLASAIALGAGCYAAQAGCAFLALDRLDPSLVSLLLYAFPVIVAAAAVALGREQPSRRLVVSLSLESLGLALVLGGAATGALDPAGTVLALAAAVVYSAYILASSRITTRVGPLVMTTLLVTGAASSLTLATVAAGDFDPGRVRGLGYLWLGGLALVSTVCAIAMFCAGLRRVGATAAATLSTLEPIVALALAFAVFGNPLRPLQLAGATLVLAAVFAVDASTQSEPPLVPVVFHNQGGSQ